MITKSLRRLFPYAMFGAVGYVLACAPSSSSSPGVTNAQPPDRCLDKGAACVSDDDCCTLWCANGSCARKQP